jgi:hypothetical protein
MDKEKITSFHVPQEFWFIRNADKGKPWIEIIIHDERVGVESLVAGFRSETGQKCAPKAMLIHRL